MAKSSEESSMQVEGLQECRCPANVEHSRLEHGVLHFKGKQSALHPTDMLSAVSTMDTMPTTSEMASSIGLDALDSDLENSLHRYSTETVLYGSLDSDLGMEQGRHCAMSVADSVSDCSDVHGDSLLDDPLLSELPIEYSDKNRSPFPHAKRMWQKQSVDVGREQGASIPWQRSKRILCVEDFTSPLKLQTLEMVGGDLCTPWQEHTAEVESFQKCLTRKHLPLTHFFGEGDLGHAPVSTSEADSKADVYGNAKLEETLKAQNVDMVGSDLYVPWEERPADFEPSQKPFNFKNLPLMLACDEEYFGICEPDLTTQADLKSDMFGKAGVEEPVINFDALDLALEDSLHRDLAGTVLCNSVDFDVSMDEGRLCDISYDHSVYSCSAVHGDPLLGDPLLSELPSEYMSKNKSPFPHAKLTWQEQSPFPHAKLTWQEQSPDVGRQRDVWILWRRRMLRAEDSESQAEVEETLKAQNVHLAGSDLHAPLHETWKDLPLTHSFDEDDVGLHASDSVLKFDVFGRALAEESLKAENVDTVGGDPYASLRHHAAVLEPLEKSLAKKDLLVTQSCEQVGVKIHVLAGAPVLALRRKLSGA